MSKVDNLHYDRHDIMHIIQKKEDLDMNLLKVKKPYITSHEIRVFDIVYDNGPLLFQTPTARVPYSYSLFDNNSFKIDVELQDDDFHKLLASINDRVLAVINKYDDTILHQKDYCPYICNTSKKIAGAETTYTRLKFKTNHISTIEAFDLHGKKMNVLNVQTFDKVNCLFNICRLVVYKESYQFQVNLIQIKAKTQYVFDDDTQSQPLVTIPACLNADKYDKYHKMRKFGVPWVCVKRQMGTDGVEAADIEAYETVFILKKTYNRSPQSHVVVGANGFAPPPPPPPHAPPLPPPPPPPPPPPNGILRPPPPPPPFPPPQTSMKPPTLKGPGFTLQFLQDIKSNNFKLKKSSGSSANSSVPGKPNIVGNQLIPSLQDILKARSQLKKICLNSKD